MTYLQMDPEWENYDADQDWRALYALELERWRQRRAMARAIATADDPLIKVIDRPPTYLAMKFLAATFWAPARLGILVSHSILEQVMTGLGMPPVPSNRSRPDLLYGLALDLPSEAADNLQLRIAAIEEVLEKIGRALED